MQTAKKGSPRRNDPTEDVARIVYASESRIRGAVYTEMENIRACAVRNNVPLGIYTALLYQSGWFLQWKEGAGDALQKLMARVEADHRHHSLRILHSSRGPRLLCGPWSMGIVLTREPIESMGRRVQRVRHELQAGVQYSPPAVWRQLSSPMEHPEGVEQSDPEAFQRVLVCAAVASPSFHLVQWIGRHFDQTVVHRRFAGDAGTDVGTDYVDLIDGDRVMRVIAMARKGLAVPLTRAFLPDYSHIVLLLSGSASLDLDLLQKVAQACAATGAMPMLLGVAQEAATHGQAFSLAHRLGLVYLDAQADPLDVAAVWRAVYPLLARWRR